MLFNSVIGVNNNLPTRKDLKQRLCRGKQSRKSDFMHVWDLT